MVFEVYWVNVVKCGVIRRELRIWGGEDRKRKREVQRRVIPFGKSSVARLGVLC